VRWGYCTRAKGHTGDHVQGVTATAEEIRLQTVVVAPWEGAKGLTYSILGLGVDGIVYRYDPGCEGWVAWSMQKAGCRDEHEGRR